MIAALLLAFVIAVYVPRRSGVLAPATVFTWVCAMSMLTFYVIGTHGLIGQSISHYWHVRNDYRDVSPLILSFYLVLVLIGGLASMLTPRASAIDRSRKGARSTLSTLFSHDLDRYLLSKPMFLLLLLAFFLALLHAIDIDYAPVIEHYTYLETRRPENVGLDSALTQLFHRGLGPLSCVIGALAVFLYRRGAWTFATLATVIALYTAMHNLSGASRWVSLQLFTCGLMFQVSSNRKMSRSAAALYIAGVITYAAVVKVRNMSSIGLLPITEAVLGLDFLVEDFVSVLFLSLFGGGFVCAEALQRVSVYYSFKYKVLSFSPLISIFDGFAGIQQEMVKATVTAPFNNFAEAYHFGAPVLAGYLVVLTIFVTVLNRFWVSHGGGLRLLMVAPAYLAFYNIHLYPIRNSFRLLFYAAVVVFVYQLITVRRQRRLRYEQTLAGAPRAMAPRWTGWQSAPTWRA